MSVTKRERAVLAAVKKRNDADAARKAAEQAEADRWGDISALHAGAVLLFADAVKLHLVECDHGFFKDSENQIGAANVLLGIAERLAEESSEAES